MNRSEILSHWFSEETYEDFHSKFVESLCDENGLFQIQESTYFDYKDQFPFSLSDEYAHGIIRLICAFHNTFGGIIIFGVHDTKRTSGHNKVKVNVERINTVIRDTVTSGIECVHHKYNNDNIDVDLLFVPKRKVQKTPVRLKRQLGKYPTGTLWFRRGHEVLRATSEDTAFLFGPRTDNQSGNPHKESTESRLPNNPSTIKRFVGRVSILCDLFDWLLTDDEPRKFLWGRGGSGKSTVAYEFARLIKENSDSIAIEGTHAIDFIIYLSAKEQALDPITAKVGGFSGNDFSTFRGLLEALITLSPGTDNDLAKFSYKELEKTVKSFIELNTLVIVIDDIDTLTTKGEDGGLDFLYRAVVRSNSGSRLLYTQRNAPTASLSNAIEVPGLEIDFEYKDFVKLCCEQFRQPLPSSEFMNGDLYQQSEGIPLIVETIVGLRRTTGSYERALEKFLSQDGSSAREYLFKREYDRLEKDNRARHLLAALACFNKGASNQDLQTVLRYDIGQIEDAIGETYEMFLTVQNTSSDETLYSLNDVTRSFVLEQSKNLQFFPNIKEKVAALLRGVHPQVRKIARLEFEVSRLVNTNQAQEALTLLQKEHDPRITEHPMFRMLRGRAYAYSSPPRYADAREDFRYCISVGFDDANMMREWANMERDSGIGATYLTEICDSVLNNPRFSSGVKAEFMARKASNIYYMAIGEAQVNPTDAFEKFSDSLFWNCKAYVEYVSLPNYSADKNFFICRNTGIKFIEVGFSLGYDKVVLDRFERLGTSIKGFRFDPLSEPLISFINTLPRSHDKPTLQRRFGLLNDIFKKAKQGKGFLFSSVEVCEPFLRAISHNLAIIREKLHSV